MKEQTARAAVDSKQIHNLDEHIIEIVSDSGEGAQTAGQMFATIMARSGNSVWTVEIIPAEIEPPARTPAGASGNCIRVGSFPITNAGDGADLVIGFNEQVLQGGKWEKRFKPGCIVLLESMWATHRDPEIAAAYAGVVSIFREEGYRLFEVPMETECSKYIPDPRKGKNMFVVGILCNIYGRDLQLARI